MTKLRILFGVPIYHYIEPIAIDNHKKIIRHAMYDIDYVEMRGGSVEHNKSRLYKEFLKGDWTHYLNCDADIISMDPLYNNPINILVGANKDIVGGIYVCKRGDLHPSHRELKLQELWEKNGKPPENYIYKCPRNLHEVSFLAGGMVLSKREVIEKLYNKYDKVPNLPMIHPKTGEYLSEDFSYCFRVRQEEYKIWADGSIKLGHLAMKPLTLEDYYKYNKIGDEKNGKKT